MQNINFYDRSLRLERDWLAAPVAVAMLAAAAAVVVVAGAALQWRTRELATPAEAGAAALQAEQAALLAMAQKLAAVRPDAALEQRLAAAQRTLDQHQAALRMLREGGSLGTSGYAPALQALARQSVDGLWLTVLSLDRGDLALRGRSLRPELIPVYVERLRLEPALRGRAFRSLDIRRPDADRDAATASLSDAPKPAAPTRAPYVEFSLAGSGSSAAGARP